MKSLSALHDDDDLVEARMRPLEQHAVDPPAGAGFVAPGSGAGLGHGYSRDVRHAPDAGSRS